MLGALVAGTTDIGVLADLARGRLRTKIPALREALQSRFGAHHAVIVSAILAKLDFLEELIAGLSAQIETAIAPFSNQVQLLDTIPGVDQRTAQGLLAEIGADMQVFATASRLASWAAVCPGNHESAGRSASGKTRKGPRWLGIYLHDAAMSAVRTKNSYLGRTVRTAATPPGPQQGAGRRRAQHPRLNLPHAPARPALLRVGRGLLHPPRRSRPAGPQADPSTASDRLHRPRPAPTHPSVSPVVPAGSNRRRSSASTAPGSGRGRCSRVSTTRRRSSIQAALPSTRNGSTWSARSRQARTNDVDPRRATATIAATEER